MLSQMERFRLIFFNRIDEGLSLALEAPVIACFDGTMGMILLLGVASVCSHLIVSGLGSTLLIKSDLEFPAGMVGQEAYLDPNGNPEGSCGSFRIRLSNKAWSLKLFISSLFGICQVLATC